MEYHVSKHFIRSLVSWSHGGCDTNIRFRRPQRTVKSSITNAVLASQNISNCHTTDPSVPMSDRQLYQLLVIINSRVSVWNSVIRTSAHNKNTSIRKHCPTQQIIEQTFLKCETMKSDTSAVRRGDQSRNDARKLYRHCEPHSCFSAHL